MGRGKLDEPNEVPVLLRAARQRQQARHAGGTSTTSTTATTPESWDVAEALASLHPEHREVLVETFYRGSSVAQAAATLGITSGTVKLRTFFALKALKQALAERQPAMTEPTDASA